MLIRRISKTRLRWPANALLCGAGITAIEYLCGCIWNRRYAVWDYRKEPLHVNGQICLRFSVVWCLLSSVMLHIYRIIDHRKRPD